MSYLVKEYLLQIFQHHPLWHHLLQPLPPLSTPSSAGGNFLASSTPTCSRTNKDLAHDPTTSTVLRPPPLVTTKTGKERGRKSRLKPSPSLLVICNEPHTEPASEMWIQCNKYVLWCHEDRAGKRYFPFATRHKTALYGFSKIRMEIMTFFFFFFFNDSFNGLV